MYTLKELIAHLETLAPAHLAETWDNVGLMIGSRKQKISKVLCALDLNLEVVDEAIEKGVQLIVTHHPCFFKPMKHIDLDTPIGQMVKKLIQHEIAVFAMHTNLDIAKGGMNDYLATKLDLKDVTILSVTSSTKLQKLAIYVPTTHYEVVRNAVMEANRCKIGNYIGCTFAMNGKGTFVPLEGSDPYLGTVNTLEVTEEYKLECMIYPHELDKIMNEVKKVHPYEEIAYDVLNLENIEVTEGLGRVGMCEPITIQDLITKLKEVFGIPYVRLVGKENKQVTRIALCSGSGASFIGAAAKQADVYITGDVGFHGAQDALARGLCVIDVGHYASENIAMPLVKDYLEAHCDELEVLCSMVDGETFKTI